MTGRDLVASPICLEVFPIRECRHCENFSCICLANRSLCPKAVQQSSTKSRGTMEIRKIITGRWAENTALFFNLYLGQDWCCSWWCVSAMLIKLGISRDFSVKQPEKVDLRCSSFPPFQIAVFKQFLLILLKYRRFYFSFCLHRNGTELKNTKISFSAEWSILQHIGFM